MGNMGADAEEDHTGEGPNPGSGSAALQGRRRRLFRVSVIPDLLAWLRYASDFERTLGARVIVPLLQCIGSA